MLLLKPDSVPPLLVHYTPQVDMLCRMVDETCHLFGAHAFLTSGMEGTHVRTSKHYRGEAVDFRFTWPRSKDKEFFQALTKRMGSQAKFLLESDHLHTETV